MHQAWRSTYHYGSTEEPGQVRRRQWHWSGMGRSWYLWISYSTPDIEWSSYLQMHWCSHSYTDCTFHHVHTGNLLRRRKSISWAPHQPSTWCLCILLRWKDWFDVGWIKITSDWNTSDTLPAGLKGEMSGRYMQKEMSGRYMQKVSPNS